jgi:RNA polymerase sigma-70 factor (ECF subfamily)
MEPERGGDDLAAGEARQLLERARGGDAAAFADLVRAFDPPLRGLAFNLLGDRQLMDDVLQEAYLRAFRALSGFEGRSQVGTWLYRITYNACIDELRRRRRRPWLALSEAGLESEPDPDPAPDERLARREGLRAALAALDPDERAAVWLVDAQGHGYREAGDILGIPEGTVASRLSRARAALRVALAEEAAR